MGSPVNIDQPLLESLIPPDIDATDRRAIWADSEAMLRLNLNDFPREKRFLNVSGIPGAGKTTFCLNFLKDHPGEYLYISFDAIMEGFEYYKREESDNPAQAYERWSPLARHLGYLLLNKALQSGTNILLEHSNATPDHLALYETIVHELKYDSVKINFLSIPLHLAKERAARRTRHIPSALIEERFQILQKLNPEYQSIIGTDNFTTIDTSS